MFFGIAINPSMYTKGDFWGVTQELGNHDGQTSPNGGENHLPMGFQRIIKTIMIMIKDVWGSTQELGNHDGQTSPNGGENHIPTGFERISKTIL